MISSPTRKYRLTQLPFRKVIGENAIRAPVLIKPSISHGITGIRRLSVLGDLVSQGRGMWRLGTDSRAETHLGTKEAAQRLQAAGGPTARQLQPPNLFRRVRSAAPVRYAEGKGLILPAGCARSGPPDWPGSSVAGPTFEAD